MTGGRISRDLIRLIDRISAAAARPASRKSTATTQPEMGHSTTGADWEARLDHLAVERLLHDRDIGEVANALVDEVLALSARAQALKRALKRPRFAVNLCRVRGEPSTAGVAATVALRLEASDLAAQLLTAVRAANRDLHAVDLALEAHGINALTGNSRRAGYCPESPDDGSPLS